MQAPVEAVSARDRLLAAAAELLDAAQGAPVSTRAICDRAGVRAPTLYHHFGNKQGLVDAVVEYGLGQYVPATDSGDAVADVRRGWDQHVKYGLDHPAFYALLYGRIAPGRPCQVTAVAERQLRVLLERLDGMGLLLTTPEAAAQQIVAANVGITLQLIAQPEGVADVGGARALRETVLAGVISASALGSVEAEVGRGAVAEAAASLVAALSAQGSEGSLSGGEQALLEEWLSRLAIR
jgi:AcrR family transcriptional regulator